MIASSQNKVLEGTRGHLSRCSLAHSLTRPMCQDSCKNFESTFAFNLHFDGIYIKSKSFILQIALKDIMVFQFQKLLKYKS